MIHPDMTGGMMGAWQMYVPAVFLNRHLFLWTWRGRVFYDSASDFCQTTFDHSPSSFLYTRFRRVGNPDYFWGVMSHTSNSEIVKSNPIGAGLSRFYSSFDLICKRLGLSSSLDAVHEIDNEGNMNWPVTEFTSNVRRSPKFSA
jgi:hypothetical protein